MRNLLTNAMVVTVGLCLLVAVVAFGAVTSDLAAPVYGLALVATVCWAVKLLPFVKFTRLRLSFERSLI